jgi:hypothetical protein
VTATWGVVTTVKAPEEQILAFVAHHLSLGAAHVWVYFDDPDDPAYPAVSRLPRVTARRCTDWHWILLGGRDNRHQRRQAHNARHAQRKCRFDWLAHLDVDEFLHAPRPIGTILAEAPPSALSLQIEGFEALHDPDLPDDIFTARHFRGPLQDTHTHLRPAIFGKWTDAMWKGSLGHNIGKCICRPRARGLVLDLHLVTVGGEVLRPPFHPELRVLHFHAQDRAAWFRILPFRLSRGAYHHVLERPLKAALVQAGPEELQDFYQSVMTLTPEKAALLQQHDRLITADLGLRAKVADLRAGRLA